MVKLDYVYFCAPFGKTTDDQRLNCGFGESTLTECLVTACRQHNKQQFFTVIKVRPKPDLMKKILTLCAVALATLGTITVTHAQRIAVVDINAVLEGMDDYKAAQTELDRVADAWRQEIAQEYDKIKGMYNRYQAEQVLLSDEARKEREDEIVSAETRVREMQKNRFGPDGELFDRRAELVQPIQDKVYGAISSFADKRGYDLIFDKGSAAGLLFSKETFDKTEEVQTMITTGN